MILSLVDHPEILLERKRLRSLGLRHHKRALEQVGSLNLLSVIESLAVEAQVVGVSEASVTVEIVVHLLREQVIYLVLQILLLVVEVS